MPRLASLMLAATMLMAAISARAETSSGDARRGARLFGACVACHSLVPDRNLTGPSLAGFWDRKAGTLESFERYSAALKASSVVWDENTLDEWLTNPAQFVPDNRMTFAGIPQAKARADLVAFLKQASGGQISAQNSPGGAMGGMMGAPMAPEHVDLKKLGPEHQVKAVRYCRDTYHVTTADGKTADFWEVNLRLKTDSTDRGPPDGTPVILPAGMMGDRASLFFAKPEEISSFIQHQC